MIIGTSSARSGRRHLSLRKKRSKDNSTAAIAGGVTGVGTAGLVSIAWPLLLIGIPVAWWLTTQKKQQKALPPGAEHRDSRA